MPGLEVIQLCIDQGLQLEIFSFHLKNWLTEIQGDQWNRPRFFQVMRCETDPVFSRLKGHQKKDVIATFLEGRTLMSPCLRQGYHDTPNSNRWLMVMVHMFIQFPHWNGHLENIWERERYIYIWYILYYIIKGSWEAILPSYEWLLLDGIDYDEGWYMI